MLAELCDENVYHDLLLFWITVHFERDDQWIRRCFKGIFFDDRNTIRERDRSGQGTSVNNNRTAIVSIPAVDLDASTALLQGPDVSLDTGASTNLATKEIRIVRARNEVLIQRAIQIVACPTIRGPVVGLDIVIFGTNECRKGREVHLQH